MNIQKFCDKLEEKLDKNGIDVLQVSDLDNQNNDANIHLRGQGQFQNMERLFFFRNLSDNCAETYDIEKQYESLKEEVGKKDAMKEIVSKHASLLTQAFYQEIIKNYTIPVFLSKSYAEDHNALCYSFSDFLAACHGQEIDVTALDIVVAFQNTKTNELLSNDIKPYINSLDQIALFYMRDVLYIYGGEFHEYDGVKLYTEDTVLNLINLLYNTVKDLYISFPNGSFIAVSEKEEDVSKMVQSMKDITYESESNYPTYPTTDCVYHFYVDELVLEPVEEELEEELDETEEMEMD